MSRAATDWAWRSKPGSSSRKLVLLAMADRADEEHRCFPSIARLVDDTNLNRKTIIKVIHELEELSLIVDTGERRGSTSSVKVYRLVLDKEAVPKTEQVQKRNGSKNGTAKQSQYYAEAVPILPTSSPNFTRKQSQNWDTEPVKEPVNESLNNSLETKPAPKTKKSQPDFSPWHALGDLPQATIDEWVAYRRAKKNPASDTVIRTAAKEFEILISATGMTVSDCIAEWLMRGWQGFKASWVLKDQQPERPNHHARADTGYTTAQASLERLTDTSW